MQDITCGAGIHAVTLRFLDSGNGLCLLLTGGEAPHIGCVVMAVPRPSLRGSGTSCDVYSLPVPGHKDGDVAIPLAKYLCSNIRTVITLSAGIHVDNATAEDIRIIQQNCQLAGEQFLATWDRLQGSAGC